MYFKHKIRSIISNWSPIVKASNTSTFVSNVFTLTSILLTSVIKPPPRKSNCALAWSILSIVSGIIVSIWPRRKENPLTYTDKIKHVRKMFPKHGRQVMIDKKVRTALEAVVSLYNQGIKNITMIVGDDRVREFNVLLNKYNGQKSRHGFF